MSNYYLKKGLFGNARACILKYLEKKPENSGYSWRILGTSHPIQASAS